MDTLHVLRALASGNYHVDLGAESLKAWHLGEVNEEFFSQLVSDADTLIKTYPSSQVAKKNHTTNWTKPTGEVKQWSLFTTHRDTSNTSDDFNYSNIEKKRPVALKGIQKLCNSLPDLVNMRLNYIDTDSSLSPHEEHLPIKLGNDKVTLRARFHLPIYTNDTALMLADNDLFHFERGSIYCFNNGCVHSAANRGPNYRVHLVWDMLMSEKALSVMFGDDPPTWIVQDIYPAPVVETIQVDKFQPSVGMEIGEFRSKILVAYPGA